MKKNNIFKERNKMKEKNIFEERIKTMDADAINEWWKEQKRNSYKKYIKKDVEFMLWGYGLAFIATLLFFSVESILFKALNLCTVATSFLMFVINTKEFVADLDELANIK